MTYNKLDNLLFFVLGFVVGGFLLLIILSILQSGRISRYEQIIDRLQKQNKKLRRKLSEETCKNSPETEHCIFCGGLISRNEIVCNSCLKNNL